MAKKKENEDFAAGLAESFERWEYLKEHGGSDPSYADGTNMNLVRNHIMYYKNKMVEEYGRDYEKYPEIFYRELPPEVKDSYMARAGEIKDGAAQALEYYIADPSFLYLLANKEMLTEKEAKKISLYNVLGYASGLARAIKDGDLITMRRHAGRPEGYLESFAQCATRMMKLIDEKKKSRNRCRKMSSFLCSSSVWRQGSADKGCLFMRRPAYGILLPMQHAGRAASRGERIPLLD